MRQKPLNNRINCLLVTGILVVFVYIRIALRSPSVTKNNDVRSSIRVAIPVESNRNITEDGRRLPSAPGEQRRLPKCIIIGFPKCGTGALREFLALHADIKVYEGKPRELNFFNKNYDKGLSYYLNKMPPSREGQITMEKSAGYVTSQQASRRMKAMDESIQVLAIVRDPVKRLVSRYAEKQSKQLTNDSFEETFLSRGQVRETHLEIRKSQYVTYLRNWMDVFSQHQLYVINGDAFIHNPLPELQKIETFLQLRHNITEYNVYFNKEKGFFCLRNWHGEARCLSEGKGRPHPVLDPQLTDKLADYFRPYNKQFNELLGVDFGWPV